MKITEGMLWPPMGMLEWKMAEHSAWFSGSAEVLANFYADYMAKNIYNLPVSVTPDLFWGRQSGVSDEIQLHVPIAGDICETSANMLFAESPTIKIAEAHKQAASATYKEAQVSLDSMLFESLFFRRIVEAAEACAGIGGVYVKLAWDEEISEYPIPVVVQGDRGIPEFTFGILTKVTFWQVVAVSDNGNKYFRLLETYERGIIRYDLYQGTIDRLGNKIALDTLEETKGLEESIETPDILCAAYIPNVLPNRLDRNSYCGRSDYLGLEGLMDSLDATFTAWMKDVEAAQAKILIPEAYLKSDGTRRSFSKDKSMYVRLDIDPTSINGNIITPQQFALRAEEFEKTTLNLLERIIAGAGYSPQSFGLNIAGRAETGTALNIRERKTFSTKSKKEKYWEPALRHLIKAMVMIYNAELGGSIDENVTLSVSFSDSVASDISVTANAIKLLSDAMAISTETKVKLLNPEWEEETVKLEVEKILQENGLGPDMNPDNAGVDDDTNFQ